MINGKKVLGIIPARGGSKGIKKKNIKLLNGKPLITWTIESARRSAFLDKVIVSSDDEEIMDISKKFGAEVPFKRPTNLAQDDTPGIDPILHALENFKDYEYVVLLQPTSPLRRSEDIDNAIKLCITNNATSCISVVENSTPFQWIYKMNNDSRLTNLFNNEYFPYQRQKAETTYVLNGAVYVVVSKSLIEHKSFIQNDTVAYVMPKERSVDIDDLNDFYYCDYLLKNLTI
ncbi:cytidylyltransferase domain-containing protein [Terribacillus sp. DMT04]|uniref:acylneuraminate cytidylyltransferase family protein n=1 Tax=Terribacillus sp. DMT04 TaxID=2850441 RepID=UPI001C2C795A|nr:acylneuraminate cytidylyltransferase family protein [Terribacillus sp. DMT04]QXE00951.1 acylneuraminate cytidylyltransferase family protein [Terribacillus sp. DMT04]